jgi:ABC-type polysaccharide/polyol phosphate transport system ATPase subunit
MSVVASFKHVTVHFPIYSLGGRSLKRQILDISTGGRISRGHNNLVVVEALSDVSIDLKEGDRVGIIGHNGAGKTTLLRILSGVYEPSHGSVSIYGKTAALFDLALGMEGEATGHENIILRGLFNGMSLSEIKSYAPSIAEFCGLGDYLQMPMRTYSSGMALRLAFAVATCKQPEVILLDEWISTLDDEFMQKAKKRLHEMTEKSKVLVMASHQIDLLKDLCNKAMFMEHGKLIAFGPIDEVLAQYLPQKTA